MNGAQPWIQVSKTWTAAAVPLAIALAFGFAGSSLSGGAGWSERGVSLAPEGMLAAGSALLDSDGDGLSDAQEQVLGSSPFFADTDGDGYGDAEELARNSSLTDRKSYPLPAGTDISMSARGEHGQLRVVVATYLADGDLASRGVDLGVVFARRLFFLDPTDYLGGTHFTQVPARNAPGVVLVMDVPIGENLVHTFGDLSVFSTLNSAGQSTVLGASSVDLLSRDGVIVLVQDPGEVRAQVALPSGGTGYGAVYNPIPPNGGGDIPASWVPGEICYQASVVVGVANGITTREVVAADCLDGYDASCRADCSSSVGEVFDTFDPLGLVGN